MPRELFQELRKATCSVRVPEYSEPGHHITFDVLANLCEIHGSLNARSKVHESVHYALTLNNLWTAIQTDGLLIGVAVNHPELAFASFEVAHLLNLPKAKRFLKKVSACIPNKVLKMSIDDRLDWYESKDGKKLANRLNTLDDHDDEVDDFGQEAILACIECMLDNPDQFFKMK